MTTHPNRWPEVRPSNPTPAQIRALRMSLGFSVRQAAELVHASLVSWQQWEENPAKGRSRRMHPAFWELAVIKARRILAARMERERREREWDLRLQGPAPEAPADDP